MTRYEKQIAELTIEKLAERNIRIDEEDIWDDSGVVGKEYYCLTSDHQEFYDFDEALAHEITWLKQEANDEEL